MVLHQSLPQIWNYCLGRKTRSQYISSDVVDTYNISNTQKISAKKAIVWLLSKAPHTVAELADHFEMSPELVNHLLEELLVNKTIQKKHGRPERYLLADLSQNGKSDK